MRNEKVKNRGYAIAKSMLKVAIIGNFTTVITLGICAYLIWSGKFPESLMADLVIVSVFIGAVISGFVMCKKERKGTMFGALGGLSYMLLLMVIGVFRVQEDLFSQELIKLFIAAMIGGIFGNVLFFPKKARKKITKR